MRRRVPLDCARLPRHSHALRAPSPQALAQLAAHTEEDWLLVREHGSMILLERTLGRAIERPVEGKSNWWKLGGGANTAAKERPPVAQVSMSDEHSHHHRTR